MQFRNLGRSGLRVSLVGLGCNNFGGRIDLDATRKVVDAAIDSGITLFDTADIYGEKAGSERVLGEVLGARDALAMPGGAQAFNMAFPIHASKVGGWAWRVLLTVSGLALTMLGSFAVWSFWFRRPKAAKARTRTAFAAS